MIAQLTGTIASVRETYAVVDVQGVGYAVHAGAHATVPAIAELRRLRQARLGLTRD